MDHFTPCAQSLFLDSAAAVSPDGMAANLFKDMPVPVQPDEKLRAFLRIRPLDNETEQRPFVVTQNVLVTAPPGRSKAFKNLKDGSSGCRQFTFNHIFDEDIGQEYFYEKCALPLTVRLLRGETSLLFAYGTTNSGKSYTMRGTSSQPGVIPRALSTVFSLIDHRTDETPVFRPCRFAEADPLTSDEVELELTVRKFVCANNKQKQTSLSSFRNLSLSKDSTMELLEESSLNHPSNSDMRFSVWVSFVEFYMDTMNDLLAVEMENKKNPQLLLIQDLSTNYFVKGLRRVSVSSAEEAYCALLYGWDNLHRAATCLNKDSSRSHCVFTITLVGYENGQYGRLRQVSNLSFCDLAGSERGDRTQNTGNRLKEAGKINNSLSTLGRCISALRHNQRKKSKLVVPFRDSSLTKYFQSYFNGTGIASMIININPAVEYFDETLVTLQFSAEASDVTVSTEEARLKVKDSFTRLTQQWIQSSQRWSSFSKLKTDPRLMSTILCPENSDNDIEEEEADITAEDLESLQKSIIENVENGDVETLASLLQRIDTLSEKLKSCESDKFNMEVEIRALVNKEVRQMEQEHADDRANDRAARRELEQRFKDQIKDLKCQHRQEIEVKEKLLAEHERDLLAKRDEVADKESEVARLSQQLASIHTKLNEEEARKSQLSQQLHDLLVNNEVANDVPDIVRQVWTKIRAAEKALEHHQASHKEDVNSLRAQIQRLTTEAVTTAQNQEFRFSNRQDKECETSPVCRKDALCGPSSPIPVPQESGSNTDVIQCQDQSVQTEVVGMEARNFEDVPDKTLSVTDPKADVHAKKEAKPEPEKLQKQSSCGTSASEDADMSMEIPIGVRKRKREQTYLQAIWQKVSRF